MKEKEATLRTNQEEISSLIGHYYRIQEHRIAFGNQACKLIIGQLEQEDPKKLAKAVKKVIGKDWKKDLKENFEKLPHNIDKLQQLRAEANPFIDPFGLEIYYERMHGIEKDIYKDLNAYVKEELLWKTFLKDVKGIGAVIGAGLINLIDIREARHVSSLWKYAGLHVRDDGKAARREKGKKIDWNPLLKTLCWKIGTSFMMTSSPYRQHYDERKAYEQRKHKDLTPKHIDNRAKRFMVKRFLCDLWAQWRDLEGLPVDNPYVIDQLGHKKK